MRRFTLTFRIMPLVYAINSMLYRETVAPSRGRGSKHIPVIEINVALGSSLYEALIGFAKQTSYQRSKLTPLS